MNIVRLDYECQGDEQFLSCEIKKNRYEAELTKQSANNSHSSLTKL